MFSLMQFLVADDSIRSTYNLCTNEIDIICFQLSHSV